MKKVVVVILFILLIGVVGYFISTYTQYNDYEKVIVEKKADIEEMKKHLSDEDELIQSTIEKHNKLKEENKDKLEELEKWQKEVKKVEDLL